MKTLFYLEGKEPPSEIRENRKCLIPVVVWLMSSSYIEDEIAWISDMCQHIGIDPQLAPDVISTGFALADALIEKHEPKQATDATSILVRAEKTLLSLLNQPEQSRGELQRMGPSVLLSAQQLNAPLTGGVLQRIVELGILPMMPENWLLTLADGAKMFFFSETEVDGLTVAKELQQFIDLLLPASLQRNVFVEPLFASIGEALAHHDGELGDVWEGVMQSFIDSLED